MATCRCAKAALRHQSPSTDLPHLLRDALLRTTLHPLDSVLCPLLELFYQLHPARIIPGYWTGYACGAPQAFLVSTFSADGATAGHRCRAESVRPTHQFDRCALLWGR